MSELDKFRELLEQVRTAWVNLDAASCNDVGIDMCPQALIDEAHAADRAIEKLFIEALHP